MAAPPPSMDPEQKRGRAILEILDTEQSYQKQLGDFIAFFLRELESGEHDQARAFMSVPNLAALCSNLEQIFHVSHQFCSELRFAFEQVPSSTTSAGGEREAYDARASRRWARIALGPIFTRCSSLLALYEQYVENHGFVKADLARFSASPAFQQFWQKIADELKQSLGSSSSAYRNRRGSVDSVALSRGGRRTPSSSSAAAARDGGSSSFSVAPSSQPPRVSNLEGYIILPIQRIPRYALLLKEIEKLTGKIRSEQRLVLREKGLDRFYEKELEDLKRAFGLVSSYATRMNDALRRSEANMDMMALQAQFVNRVDLVQCNEGRLLIREGELTAAYLPSATATSSSSSSSPTKRGKKTGRGGRTLYFHLLSDRILCSEVVVASAAAAAEGGSATAARFRCLYNLPLESLYVDDQGDGAAAAASSSSGQFHLIEHFEHTLLFSLSSSSSSSKLWVNDLRQCIKVSAKCDLPPESDKCPLCLRRKFLSWWCKRCGVACCAECCSRRRFFPDSQGAADVAEEEDDPALRCCDMCRLELDLTSNEEEPGRFRLVVKVHSCVIQNGALPTSTTPSSASAAAAAASSSKRSSLPSFSSFSGAAPNGGAAGGAPPAALTAQDFFSLTPRDAGRQKPGQPARVRGPSTMGHAACFSIPIGPMPEVEEEEQSRFWVLHCFSGQKEVGHVTLDVEQVVCSRDMFLSEHRRTEHLQRFSLESSTTGTSRRSVSLSFELQLPPALYRTKKKQRAKLDEEDGEEDDEEEEEEEEEDLRLQTSTSQLLKIPGVRAALSLEERAQRFANPRPTPAGREEKEEDVASSSSTAAAAAGVNTALLVHYEKMARERPSKFSILCVKYLYTGLARLALDLDQSWLLEQVQARDVTFDRYMDKHMASLARESASSSSSSGQLLLATSHLSLRALEHFGGGGPPPVASSPRDAVLQDLIATEQTYVSALKLLNEVFVTPLIHLSHGASVETVAQTIKLQRGGGRWLTTAPSLPPSGARCQLGSEVIILLQCVRQILSVNHHLLTELQRAAAGGGGGLGDTFQKFSVVLKVYIAYLTYHADVERLLLLPAEEDGTGLVQFASFLQADVRCGESHHTLVKLLRLPKARLTRYKRFLHALLMHTTTTASTSGESGDASAGPLRESLRLLEASEEHMSWSVRRRGNLEKLMDIQRGFLKVLPLQRSVPQLVSGKRWFIKEGDLVKRCRRDDRMFRFWLFNDSLVYGERMGGQYRFCRMLLLKNAALVDLQQGTQPRTTSSSSSSAAAVGDSRFAFELRSAAKSFICMIPSNVTSTAALGGAVGAADVTPPLFATGRSSGYSEPSSHLQQRGSAAAAASTGSSSTGGGGGGGGGTGADGVVVAGDDVKAALKLEWMRELAQCIASETAAAADEEVAAAATAGSEDGTSCTTGGGGGGFLITTPRSSGLFLRPQTSFSTASTLPTPTAASAAAAAAPVVMLYESIPACTVCEAKFSLTLRRHHCRRCGAVVCYACSKTRVVLGNLHADKLKRVCVECAEAVAAQASVHN